MRADFTDKLGLALAVRVLTMAAEGAGAGSIARVNRYNLHACDGGFVFNNAPKLPESPIRLFCPLALSNCSPRAHAFEVFDGDCSFRVLSLQNNLFRDAVVFVGLIAALLAAHRAESATGRASADLLQDSPALAMSPAFVLYALACVASAVAVGCNLSNAEVNTKRILNLLRRWRLNIAHSQKKVIAFVVNKVRLALSRFKQLLLTLPALIGNFLATLSSPDGYKLLSGAPRQNPIIKRECAKRLELTKRLDVEFISVRNFGDCSHDDLSRQVELLTYLSIGQFMQAELLECLVFPSNFTDSVAGSIGPLKSLAQQLGLFFCRIQFDLRYQFHDSSVAQIFQYGKHLVQRKERETGVCDQACGIEPPRLMPNSSPA